MNSSRKSVMTASSRSISYPYSFNKRKKAVSTQTDKLISPLEEVLKPRLNLKEDVTLDAETEKLYTLALGYVNSIHCLMNKKLCENLGESGDTNSEASGNFKLPEIPNYTTIFAMLSEKCRTPPEVTPSPLKKEEAGTKGIVKPNISELVPNIKKITQIKTRSKSDMQSFNRGKVRASNTGKGDGALFNKPGGEHVIRADENISYVKKIEIYARKNTISEETRKIDASTENSGEKEYRFLHSKIENKDKSLTVESEEKNHCSPKSKLKNDKNDNDEADLNLDMDQTSIIDLIKNRVREEINSYLSKYNERQKELFSYTEEEVHNQPQTNLLEYAQKKLERKNKSNNTEHNSSSKLRTPNKIYDMFKKMSPEHLRHNVKTFEYKSSDNQSDTESVILDDEEFEKQNKIDSREKTEARNRELQQPYSHPLKLSEKDMHRINKKMLNAIGLFTEGGEIRPGIIDTVEREKEAKASNYRNKQFRTQRQWDIKVHLQPKPNINGSPSSISMSTENSFNGS